MHVGREDFLGTKARHPRVAEIGSSRQGRFIKTIYVSLLLTVCNLTIGFRFSLLN